MTLLNKLYYSLIATKMHNFNSAIVQDDRVEVVLLPIRDGLSIIRKKN